MKNIMNIFIHSFESLCVLFILVMGAISTVWVLTQVPYAVSKGFSGECSLAVGNTVKGGGVVKGIESSGSGTRNCIVHIKFPDNHWVNDYAFKFEVEE